MKAQKQLGIWMDHANANLIDLESKDSNRSIVSEFNSEIRDEAIQKSEHTMNNKEEQMNEAFYKEISQEILKYDNVLIFGPTNAKLELKNYLNKDLQFSSINVEVESADKMTDNQQVAFVKNYFDK